MIHKIMSKMLLAVMMIVLFMPVHSKTLANSLFLNQNGCVTTNEDDAIIQQWEISYPFDDGIAIVGKKKENNLVLYGLINSEGKYLVDPVFTHIEKEQFAYGHETFYRLENSEFEGIYDTVTCKMILSPLFSEMKPLQSGQYIAVLDSSTNLWGYIDYSGKLVIPYKYDEACSFVNGYGFVEIYNESNDSIMHTVINTRDEMVALPETVEAYGTVYNNHFCIRTTGSENKYGIGDVFGNIIIIPQYDWISEFYNDYAVFISNHKYGIIKYDGNTLIPAIFNYISIDDNGIVIHFDK